jgi:hypothetical protein
VLFAAARRCICSGAGGCPLHAGHELRRRARRGRRHLRSLQHHLPRGQPGNRAATRRRRQRRRRGETTRRLLFSRMHDRDGGAAAADRAIDRTSGRPLIVVGRNSRRFRASPIQIISIASTSTAGVTTSGPGRSCSSRPEMWKPRYVEPPFGGRRRLCDECLPVRVVARATCRCPHAGIFANRAGIFASRAGVRSNCARSGCAPSCAGFAGRCSDFAGDQCHREAGGPIRAAAEA